MKNVAVMVHSLNGGGAERIAGLLSKELSKYYNVYLFLIKTDNIVYEYGGTIVDIGQSGSFYEYDISVNKKKYRIDYSISFLEEMNFANIRTKGRDYVLVSERCVQSLIQPPITSETLRIRRYYNYADAIVACSEGVKYDLVHNYQIQRNITTVYNFIDKETILLKSRSGLPEEAENFLGGMDFFVNIGRLHPQKNQKRLLYQFSDFHTSYPCVKLLILGDGIQKQELEACIIELGLADYVKILPYTQNPFAYMAKSKALILSSDYEGLPNTVLEAMTLGCPVIAADCLAGPRELLMDEMNYEKPLRKLEICQRGILICNDKTEDDGTTRYMAEAMELLYSNPSLAEDFSRGGLEYMEQYTNQRILQQWIAAIEGCGKKEETNALIEEENLLDAAEHIVIYGAGIIGRSIYFRLSGKYKIDCFAVTRIKGNERCFGVPVKEISQLQYPRDKTAMVIGVGGNSQSDVINTSREYGYYQIVFPYIEPFSYTYYINRSGYDMRQEVSDWYQIQTGKLIDIDHPKTFNEKIQWLKLYDNRPIKTELADKYAVRKYISQKIGDKYLIPLLGVWDSFEEIDFSLLPDRCVLKCTHSSSMNMVVNDKSQLNYTEADRQFKQWLGINYAYKSGFEMHYADIPPRIVAEKLLETEDGQDLRDYKVFVFNGKVKLIQVDIDRQHVHRRNLYTTEWEYVPCSIRYPTAPDVAVERPVCLDEMIHLAEVLGEGFIHVRVDFYIWKGQIYFGELTFAHGSGTEKFEPEEYDLTMGSWMELPEKRG